MAQKEANKALGWWDAMVPTKVPAMVLTLTLLLLASNSMAAPAPPPLYWWDIVFYSVALTAIALYTGALVVLRAYDWLYLSLSGIMILLLVASLDGVLANLVNGGSQFMATAPLIIGALTFGFQFAGTAWRIKTPHKYARLKVPFYGFALLSISLIPAYWLIDSLVPLYATLNTLALLVLVSTVFAPMSWDHLSPGLHRAAVLLPLTLALVGLSVYGVHFLGEGFSRPVLDWTNRLFILIYIGYSLGFGLIYVLDEVNARRRAQSEAERVAREAAEQALALREAKLEFEQASQIAAQRSRQLAEASHDIRQPIGALRHAILDLQTDQPDKNAKPLVQAIDYLEELARSYIQPNVPDANGEISRDEQARETLASRLVLNTVAQIHSAQAQQLGIDLAVVDEADQVTLRPLIMVRILSNLLANALDHAQAHKITLGSRVSANGWIFYVSDNGVGMSPTQLNAALQSGTKGESSDGYGLGLGIVQSHAKENGWSLDIESKPNTGTRASIFVPQ